MTSDNHYTQHPDGHSMQVSEADIEERFIAKLVGLKYTLRSGITNLEALEANFRQKFERLNAVTLSDSEFARLLDLITTPDVYKSAEILRGINSFERDDGTPLNYTLVNIKDWCKNDYEIVSQLRINTRSSFQRYDVILLINGIPCTQIELKTLEIWVPQPPEQQKNADCLSALDALITAQTEQIAALKEHKKGLMQQLFPNPNTQPIST